MGLQVLESGCHPRIVHTQIDIRDAHGRRAHACVIHDNPLYIHPIICFTNQDIIEIDNYCTKDNDSRSCVASFVTLQGPSRVVDVDSEVD